MPRPCSFDSPLFRFPGAFAPDDDTSAPERGRLCRLFLENFRASTSIFMILQATKSQRWMPWRLKPMKDVGGCEKPRGAADQASIRGYPNGETPHPSWGVTPA
jgi:hypothetical protein